MSGKFKNMFAAVTKNNNKSNVIVDNESMLPHSSESALALYPPNFKENFELN